MFKFARLISLFTLGPLLFYPFSYCPFRLPYVYCFICPTRCVWYKIRGAALLLIIGLNIKKGLFCNHICPLGTIQSFFSKLRNKKVAVPIFLRGLKYFSIVLILLIVISTWMNHIFSLKLKNLLWGVFLLGIIMSVFNHRFFCHNLCPINALRRK